MKATLNARLRRMGMNYGQYLRSQHWADKKAEYRASSMPQRCMACDAPNYQLHHISYCRLGKELLSDLMPLCDDCHHKVHEYEKSHRTNMVHIAKILRMMLGWTRAYTQERLAPFNLNGIKNPAENFESLTPKQKLRELRKTDPDNPTYWTAKQKARMERLSEV
jgi:hypothetical protein